MKNRVNEFFDGVTPVRSDDEIISDVLRKAENMKKENTKLFSIRKPIAAACAAVVVLGAGVTAAAATGLIDFDAIFSKHIAAENDTVAGKILAHVDNIRTKVSDEDYNAELKAVISDGGTLIGCIGLSRKDGAPVTDSFIAPMPDFENDNAYIFTSEWHGMELGAGYQQVKSGAESRAIEFIVNDNGNVDVYFDLMKNYVPELQKVVVTFNDICYMNEDINETATLLPLDVWVQFDYRPSEAALVTREISGIEEAFNLNPDSSNPVMAHVTASKLNCASASLEFTLEEHGAVSMFMGGEEFQLIKNGEVVGTMRSYLTDFNGVVYKNYDPIMVYAVTSEGNTTITYKCQYRNNDGIITAFDISEIDAISINGTIYPLK